MTARPLTHLQAQTLGAVEAGRGPSSVRDVADSLLVSGSAARNALTVLEKRGLIGAVYTGTHARGRHYEITSRGADAVKSTFTDPPEVDC